VVDFSQKPFWPESPRCKDPRSLLISNNNL